MPIALRRGLIRALKYLTDLTFQKEVDVTGPALFACEDWSLAVNASDEMTKKEKDSLYREFRDREQVVQQEIAARTHWFARFAKE
jgi:hypothetical protein